MYHLSCEDALQKGVPIVKMQARAALDLSNEEFRQLAE
jgi:hypothetical protein